MRIIVWAAVAVIVGFLSLQLYRIYVSNHSAELELGKVSMKLDELKEENNQLQADISYFSESENLAKELKSKFDYKKPGEKLIKVQ